MGARVGGPEGKNQGAEPEGACLRCHLYGPSIQRSPVLRSEVPSCQTPSTCTAKQSCFNVHVGVRELSVFRLAQADQGPSCVLETHSEISLLSEDFIAGFHRCRKAGNVKKQCCGKSQSRHPRPNRKHALSSRLLGLATGWLALPSRHRRDRARRAPRCSIGQG